MTQEERHLLLIDLSARLPYNVKCRVVWDDTSDKILTPVELFGFEMNVISEIKPYLRPMSSMTEDEKYEYNREFDADLRIIADRIKCRLINGVSDNTETGLWKHVDYLNEHHFDYRGLIPMGLALEATEGMYK